MLVAIYNMTLLTTLKSSFGVENAKILSLRYYTALLNM